MQNSNYSYHLTDGAPLKLWDRHEAFEARAMDQMRTVARLPFIHRHIAGMPDVHWGQGATVGSVIATKGAIVPAAVGVDIGCGMMAVRTSVRADQLPDNLHEMRTAIEAAVPHGRTDNGGRNDTGAWAEAPAASQDTWTGLSAGYQQIIEKHPKGWCNRTSGNSFAGWGVKPVLRRASARAAQSCIPWSCNTTMENSEWTGTRIRRLRQSWNS
jgi:tRNA-splicing ligase RtcB